MDDTPVCEWAEVIARIRQQLDSLSPQSRKVAVCLLEDPMILGVCGIEDFAMRCPVSVTCVFRFARQMGFSGFRAMRQTCKRALSRQLRVDECMMGRRSVGATARTV